METTQNVPGLRKAVRASSADLDEQAQKGSPSTPEQGHFRGCSEAIAEKAIRT